MRFKIFLGTGLKFEHLSKTGTEHQVEGQPDGDIDLIVVSSERICALTCILLVCPVLQAPRLPILLRQCTISITRLRYCYGSQRSLLATAILFSDVIDEDSADSRL